MHDNINPLYLIEYRNLESNGELEKRGTKGRKIKAWILKHARKGHDLMVGAVPLGAGWSTAPVATAAVPGSLPLTAATAAGIPQHAIRKGAPKLWKKLANVKDKVVDHLRDHGGEELATMTNAALTSPNSEARAKYIWRDLLHSRNKPGEKNAPPVFSKNPGRSAAEAITSGLSDAVGNTVAATAQTIPVGAYWVGRGVGTTKRVARNGLNATKRFFGRWFDKNNTGFVRK